ncbi:MAG: hypothetical protein AB7P67_15935, partial [Vicinamibacterales bacterium]
RRATHVTIAVDRMVSAAPSLTGDPRLRPFLSAGTDAEARAALEDLLGGDIETTLRETVARTLRGAAEASGHHDDILAEARLRLVRRLWSLRAGVGDPVANLLGYVTGTGENACYSFLRERFPERTRFRNRVRYAVAHHPGTRLTQDPQGVWICASAAAAGLAPAADCELLADPRGVAGAWGIDLGAPLAVLVEALLRHAARPLPLPAFVDALAQLVGEARPMLVTAPLAAAEEPVDPAPAIADVLEHRAMLARTWAEIVELPPRQRVALLMNLRDADGSSVLQMLPATGVVAREGIAAALDLDPRDLDVLWPVLPVDDETIATRLGLTRQQVINLRKAGRARLARRLGGRT